MTAEQLEAGYWGAYRDFYRWSSIWRAAFAHGDLREHARHLAYTGGWKKLEPMWDLGDPQRPGAPLPAAARDDPRPLRQRRRGYAGPAARSGRRIAARPGTQAYGRSFSEPPRPRFLNCERQPQLAMKR